tara:strand:+ start:8574 stop:9332 length:759 start_codon:yes stop_codon:yes gene_type:complete
LQNFDFYGLGHPQDPSAREQFETQCRSIASSYREQFIGKADENHWRMRADRWLRHTLYSSLIDAIGSDFELHCEKRIEQYRAGKRGTQGQNTYFHRALLAIFAHANELTTDDKLQRKAWLPDKNRRRNACYMWLAYRHFVAPDDLPKFVRQYPLNDVESLVAKRHFEKKLLGQVIDGLEGMSSQIEVCGEYPSFVYGAAEAREAREKRIKSVKSRTTMERVARAELDDDWDDPKAARSLDQDTDDDWNDDME